MSGVKTKTRTFASKLTGWLSRSNPTLGDGGGRDFYVLTRNVADDLEAYNLIDESDPSYNPSATLRLEKATGATGVGTGEFVNVLVSDLLMHVRNAD